MSSRSHRTRSSSSREKQHPKHIQQDPHLRNVLKQMNSIICTKAIDCVVYFKDWFALQLRVGNVQLLAAVTAARAKRTGAAASGDRRREPCRANLIRSDSRATELANECEHTLCMRKSATPATVHSRTPCEQRCLHVFRRWIAVRCSTSKHRLEARINQWT
jgi:hypothetical protein